MIELLVVDDEPLVLLTIRSLCDWAKYGIHIAHECGNGKLALDYSREHPEIDIVITDVDMPVMDGLSLAETLRSEGCTAAIIFLSSYSNFEYVRRAFKSGACDYVLKVELEESRLVDLIRKAMDARSLAGASSSSNASPDDSSDGGSGDSYSRNGKERESFFRKISGDLDPAAEPFDLKAEFGLCGFSVEVPFSFMVLRPGDMPLVRQRYGNSLYDFQKTASDLLRHFAPSGDGDVGAVSFDLYYVLMRDGAKMDNAFDLFYEAAWSYMDIGFERRSGQTVEKIEDFPTAFASCVRDFVPPSRIVVRTRRYIREHFGNPDLGLSDIADYCEVSKNHLSWEFARETGENITEFIMRTRIQEAKKLLLETNLRTYEIAEKTGYANVETFCRAFRKITGTSPRQYS
jgi:two-component system response regulator YesN